MAAFRQQVQAYADANLSPAARSRMLADIARKGVADLVASGKASPSYDTFVDGVRGADESQVRGTGGGVIHYQFNYAGAAAAFALGFLQSRAPGRTGDFRQSFYVGINGRFVTASAFNPDSVPPDAEITIGNTQPYNRKVDVQLEGGHSIRFSVPAGMYDDAVKAVRSKFRGAMKVRRVSNMRFPGQYALRNGAKAGQLVSSPAIVISPVV